MEKSDYIRMRKLKDIWKSIGLVGQGEKKVQSCKKMELLGLKSLFF